MLIRPDLLLVFFGYSMLLSRQRGSSRYVERTTWQNRAHSALAHTDIVAADRGTNAAAQRSNVPGRRPGGYRANGAFEKRALPVALEAYKLASDPRALGKKTVNA